MCTRYSLAMNEVDLSFLGVKKLLRQPPVKHIVPGHQVWLVRSGATGDSELLQAKWGLVPGWLTDLSKAQVNARAETADTRPMFKKAWRQQRCLILADSYYHWQIESGGRRRLWRIYPSNGQLMLFAGLWETYRVDESLSFESCAIVTMPAVDNLQPIAERMPAVVGRQQVSGWLSCSDYNVKRFHQGLEGVAFHCRDALAS